MSVQNPVNYANNNQYPFVLCRCGVPCGARLVTKSDKNMGRSFYSCDKCNMFIFADQYPFQPKDVTELQKQVQILSNKLNQMEQAFHAKAQQLEQAMVQLQNYLGSVNSAKKN